jgi:hypothetical protein
MHHRVGFIVGVLATLLICGLAAIEWQISEMGETMHGVMALVSMHAGGQ